MVPSARSRLYAFGVATISVAAALALMLVLNPIAQTTRTPFLLFFGAIVFTAWRAGMRAGLLATLMSTMISGYVFLPPFFSFNLESLAGVRLIIFATEGVFISLLCGSLRVAHQQLDSSVSKLQTSEDSLRSANQHITDILESITDGFYFLDHGLRFIYVNHQTEIQMRRSRQHLLGRSIWEVLPDAGGTKMGNAYQQAIANQQPVIVETPGLINPDRWYEIHIKPVPDGLAVYFREITYQKQAQADLQRSELHFRMLANTMPQMVWTTRPSGEVDYFNRRWYDYTGLTPDQSLGWGWSQAVHPEDRQRSIDAWEAAVQGGDDYQVEYRFRQASDDQYRWHLGLAFPLKDEAGQVSRWFGSCTDIHDQKLILAERDRALERERAARQDAEDASRTKDEFLAVLSHELRSPLNPILGWVTLLRSRNLGEKTFHQALETIERNAKLQAQLIEDLLDVSRILRGKLALNIEPVDLAQCIQAALETVQLSLEAKEISLKIEIAPGVEPVAGDANRLQQMIWNLLSNAVKFTPNQGCITVRLQQVGRCAHIQVQDTGRGIAADFLPYVFERFRQADSTTTRQYGGLGLGLSIVRYLCELHGGSVSVESPGENRGSTFTVWLPIQKAVSQPVASHSLEAATDLVAANSVADHLEGLTVLVIDDDPDLRDLLTVALQEHGIEVLTAASAQAGLERLNHHRPDLIICDIGMPNMDGYSLMRQLRQRSDNRRQIPAIALTAYAGEFNRQAALEAGFQKHLAKPVGLEQLKETISSLVAVRPRSSR